MQKLRIELLLSQGKIAMNGMNGNDRLFRLHSDFKTESFHPFLVVAAPKILFSFCYHDNVCLGSTVVFFIYSIQWNCSFLTLLLLFFHLTLK